MAAYSLELVESRRSRAGFYAAPRRIYAGDEAWVCPLDLELEGLCRPGPGLAAARRWLLRDAQGRPAGRIAAFVRRRPAEPGQLRAGAAGLFECVDDPAAARLLFGAAKDWLQRQGMEAMDAPIHAGENDRHWGLLVEGFVQPGFGMPYHKPYYRALFEDFGFQPLYRQLSRELDLAQLPERFLRIGEWVRRKPGLTFHHADPKHPEIYARALQSVYNAAWKTHSQFSPMTDAQVEGLLRGFRHLMIPALLPYACADGEPAAVLAAVPDLNPVFKPMQGRFPWHEQLRFLWRKRADFAWYRRRGLLTRARVVMMGVDPRFQRYGLESGMIAASASEVLRLGIRRIELGWVGDFNPPMQRILEATGAPLRQVHQTWRLVFDGSAAEPPARIPLRA
ncbi:MAG: GNAT family N-acetyltransferase [Bacteroidia bacterium]|nr:GNAT family N-acetyltransferase [Bacteroidia bacterium]